MLLNIFRCYKHTSEAFDASKWFPAVRKTLHKTIPLNSKKENMRTCETCKLKLPRSPIESVENYVFPHFRFSPFISDHCSVFCVYKCR